VHEEDKNRTMVETVWKNEKKRFRTTVLKPWTKMVKKTVMRKEMKDK